MNYQRRRALTCHEGPLDRSQKRKLIIGNACYPMAFRSRPKRVRAHLFRSRNSRIPCLSATNNVISFGFFGRLSPAGLPKEAMWDRPSPFVACRIQEGGSGLASRQGLHGRLGVPSAVHPSLSGAWAFHSERIGPARRAPPCGPMRDRLVLRCSSGRGGQYPFFKRLESAT